MLSKAEVEKIAKLSRINLTEAEIKHFQGEFATILKFVEQLNQVDTSQVTPTYQITGLANKTRPDVIDYQFTREQMFKSAIETAEDHLKVKGVFGPSPLTP
ncbi:MAG: Asp-tRNA(Asn)/Glu-tRNA(Gln) amidotransferase subunit GatC [Patescibacteria group bacterium]|jgi:aspartyl-tRNA(Asn)/glutamyl-tRNA(Gln) amidotransferase subunit C